MRIEGLNALVRDFGKMSRELRRDIRAELREAAREVADEARSIAREQGLVDSGQLARQIKPGWRRGNVAVVRESAVRATGKNAPFRYPAVYEYGRKRGNRPFLRPALERKRVAIYARMSGLVDRLTGRYGF